MNQAANLNLNRTVLYKKGHFVDSAGSFFIIEISTTDDASLFIAAYDIQSNASLLQRHNHEQAKQILTHFNHDFKAIAESVQVAEDGRSLRLIKKRQMNIQSGEGRELFSQDAAIANAKQQDAHSTYLDS